MASEVRDIISKACTEAIAAIVPPGEYHLDVAIIDKAEQALTTYIDSVVEQKVLEGRIDENRVAYTEVSKKYRGFGTRSDYQSVKYKSEGVGIMLKTSQVQKLLNARYKDLRHRYEQMKGEK